MSARALAFAARAALLGVLLLGAPAARAQSKSDAFAGKIPPVSGQLYPKAGRVETTLTGNLSLNDAFFTKYFAGLKVGYHFTEHLSAAVHGATGVATRSGSAVVCSSTRGCSDATDVMLRQVPGRLRYIVGAEAAWAPLYGKLNVLSEQVAHFDLSIFAGPDLVAHDEVLAKDVAEARAPGSETSIGGHLGLGFRLFLSERYALRLEVKDYLYRVAVPNTGAGRQLENQLFAELGLSVFLPSRAAPAR